MAKHNEHVERIGAELIALLEEDDRDGFLDCLAEECTRSFKNGMGVAFAKAGHGKRTRTTA